MASGKTFAGGVKKRGRTRDCGEDQQKFFRQGLFSDQLCMADGSDNWAHIEVLTEQQREGGEIQSFQVPRWTIS